ncbi:MAG: hypothetical protein JRJ77_16995 [Deltaproteobacteria bacterium]|nr:hypothetical protein [Deltaproteobacteria bacterium]MBW1795692.1 hypothetical protein [Deltaproteobacteria bacterium]
MNILEEWLENATENIKSADKLNGRPSGVMSGLRNLQLRLNPLILANVDPRTRFMAYFLSCYVDTVLMDLCGDTPDDGDGKLKNVRDVFFEKITQDFEKLVSCLKNNEDPLPIFEDFVVLYTQAVNKLNYLDNQ